MATRNLIHCNRRRRLGPEKTWSRENRSVFREVEYPFGFFFRVLGDVGLPSGYGFYEDQLVGVCRHK
jgi:hypothetical protein